MGQSLEQISQKTIPGLLLERVNDSPGGVAFRYKHLGIYKEVTWKQCWQEVEDFAFGLLELGLEPGDRVAIMGDPCPEWIYADLAVLCAQGIDYGIYTTSSIEEVKYLKETGGAKLFIAENQEYVDKLLQVIDEKEKESKLIVIDTKGMFMYEDSRLISFARVQELGSRRKAKYPKEVSQLIQTNIPSAPAFLIFTSGTAGPPKPAVLTQQNVLTGFVWSLAEVFPDLRSHEHRGISHLSMAHIMERAFTIYCPLLYGYVPHIGESLQYLQETIYEVQPTLVYGVPRVWQKISAQALVAVEQSSWIKKIAYRLAMRIGRAYLERRWRDKRSSLMWKLLHWISVQMAFRHLLHRLGLSQIKYATTGGAPLSTAIKVLLQTWGIDLIDIYGSTEAGGMITSESPGFTKPGTVGKPTSACEVRLTEEGEVIASGPGIFCGYWNDEQSTRETIRDGWLYTGDVGELTEDGDLKLTDRKKDIMITAGGKNITPSLIETSLKESPFISEAILIADGRKFPAGLIEIDFETVSAWARANKVLYTSYTSLATHAEVYELISGEIQKTNQKFARVEQVKKFRIIPKELDPEEGDTTATRKIKRKRMYEMFDDLIEEMYSEGGKGAPPY